MKQLSPISPVRADNFRLVKDAETVREVATAYAGMLELGYRTSNAQPPNRFGAVGAALLALPRGGATLVTYEGDMYGWLNTFEQHNSGLWCCERKASATWIVERLR